MDPLLGLKYENEAFQSSNREASSKDSKVNHPGHAGYPVSGQQMALERCSSLNHPCLDFGSLSVARIIWTTKLQRQIFADFVGKIEDTQCSRVESCFFSLKDVHQRLESNSNTQATSHGRATFLFCPSLIAMAFSQRRSLSAFSVVAGFFTLGQVSTWYEPQSRGLTGVKLIL